jgi:hypothetical protein
LPSFFRVPWQGSSKGYQVGSDRVRVLIKKSIESRRTIVPKFNTDLHEFALPFANQGVGREDFARLTFFIARGTLIEIGRVISLNMPFERTAIQKSFFAFLAREDFLDVIDSFMKSKFHIRIEIGPTTRKMCGFHVRIQ